MASVSAEVAEAPAATAESSRQGGTDKPDSGRSFAESPGTPHRGGRPYQELVAGVVVHSPNLVVLPYHSLGDTTVSHYTIWQEGRQLGTARVLAADPFCDLALLETDAQGLMPATLGAGQRVQSGQKLLCLPPAPMVSGRWRPSHHWAVVVELAKASQGPRLTGGLEGAPTLYRYGGLWLVESPPVASGSPLFDLNGQLVGIITSATALDGYDRLSSTYALPVNELFCRAVQTLCAGGQVQYGFLGVNPQQLAGASDGRQPAGVRLLEVLEGTPAAAAGLRDDDVISRLGDQPIETPEQLIYTIGSLPPGTQLQLRVHRHEGLFRRWKSWTTTVTLTQKPLDGMLPPVITTP